MRKQAQKHRSVLLFTLISVGLVHGLARAADDTVTIVGYNPIPIFVLNNDQPGSQLSRVSPPGHGTATIAGNAVRYTAAAEYQGEDRFTYTTTGNGGGTFTVRLTVTANSQAAAIQRRFDREPAFRAEFVHNLRRQVADDPQGEVASRLRDAIRDKASADPWFERRFGAMFRAAGQQQPIDLYVFIGDDDIQGVTESGDFNSADAAFSERMAQRGQVPLVLNCAVAGSSVVQWSSLDAPGHMAPAWLTAPRQLDLSRDCMDSVDTILANAPEGTAVRGLLIGLGASDAVMRGGRAPQALIDAWPAQLSRLVDLYRAAYGADMTVLLLGLPELERASGRVTRAWASIEEAQGNFRTYRYQRLNASGLATWEDDAMRPRLSDAGQRSLANRLVDAFLQPQTPRLGETTTCSVFPCFPGTSERIDPQRCAQGNFFRSEETREMLCDQYGNSLHAMSAACGDCFDLRQVARAEGVALLSARTTAGFTATNHIRLGVADKLIATVPYDNPYTQAAPGNCGDQSREAVTFVLPAGTYRYRAEAHLAEDCFGGARAGCGPLLEPGQPPVDTYQRGTSVGVGNCLQITLGAARETVTLSRVQSEIFNLCANCHVNGTGEPTVLYLGEGIAHGATVNVPSDQQPKLMLIAPGDPANSYLMRKVLGTASTGFRMPPTPRGLNAARTQLLHDWIEQGARDN